MNDKNTDLAEADFNIVEFDKVEASLVQLEQDYSEVPDVSTKEGYKQCQQAISVLRPLRTGVEKVRTQGNRADRETIQHRIDFRNSEAKRITQRISALEDPMKQAKDEYDNEQKRIAAEKLKAEDDRKQAHKDSLQGISEMAPVEIGDIEFCIETLKATDTKMLEEFQDEGERLIQSKLAQLEDQLKTKQELEKQRIENQRIQREQEEQDRLRQQEEQRKAKLQERLDKIRMMNPDSDSSSIREQIASLNQIYPETFDDYSDECKALLEAKISQFENALQKTIERENLEQQVLKERQENQRLKNEAIAREKQEKMEQEEKQKEIEEQERLARLEALKPDIEIAVAWCQELQKVSLPEIGDDDLKSQLVELKVNIAKLCQDFIDETKS